MIILKHHTDVASAVTIIDEAQFRPRYPDPRAGDSGLNCFIEGRPANRGQCIERQGATLSLGWSGPVQTGGVFPLTPDVLFDFLPWRAVVPHGTTRHLAVLGLEASQNAWEQCVEPAPWYCITAGLKRAFRARRAAIERTRILEKIDSCVSLCVRP